MARQTPNPQASALITRELPASPLKPQTPNPLVPSLRMACQPLQFKIQACPRISYLWGSHRHKVKFVCLLLICLSSTELTGQLKSLEGKKGKASHHSPPPPISPRLPPCSSSLSLLLSGLSHLHLVLSSLSRPDSASPRAGFTPAGSSGGHQAAFGLQTLFNSVRGKIPVPDQLGCSDWPVGSRGHGLLLLGKPLYPAGGGKALEGGQEAGRRRHTRWS